MHDFLGVRPILFGLNNTPMVSVDRPSRDTIGMNSKTH
jgi:hypothetical protein